MLETNQIYLGDSYKLIKEIDDKSIDCIYTDVPYLYFDNGRGKSELSQRISERKKEIQDISNGFDYSILDEFCRVLKKINIFIRCSKLQIRDLLNYFNNLGAHFEILVWCKVNPAPLTCNSWLPDIEYCLYFRESGVPYNNDYEYKHKFYLGKLNKSDKDLYFHPTIKPLDCVIKHLKHVTQEGDIVLDPFLGSGTTAVACKSINRKYIGFEINEDYFKSAVDRLNGITQVERQGNYEQLKLW